MLESKFRLLDGESDLSIYPDKIAYKPAVKVTDYKHFAKKNINFLNLNCAYFKFIDKKYPFSAAYYLDIRYDEPKNSVYRKLRDYMLTDKGRGEKSL